MRNFSVDETNKLYECAKHCRTYNHIVYQQAFEKLCMAIRHIEDDLGEQAQDDYWQGLLRELKRFRFKLCAAPIPINFLSIQLLVLLEDNKKNCQNFFPSFVPKLQNIIDNVSDLVEISDNPLLEKISELILPGYVSRAAILLKENYLFSMVEDVIISHPMLKYVELVNKYQLRGSQCYQQLFVIGPHYWFPDYIFRAPRAEDIHYLRYSWIPDTWITAPVFITPTASSTITDGNSLVSANKTVYKSTDEKSEDPEKELVPEINWHKLSTKLLKHTLDDHTQEMVSARLYLLARDHAVFLEANEHTKTLALDFEISEEEDEEVQQVKRMPTSKLQPGMFLLLRTEGGGDYIVPIANKILGEDAVKLREMQEHWKTLLRKEVETKGLLPVCIDLLDRGGSKLIKEINLHYWMSSRSIRPQEDDDFSAIMSLVGLQDQEVLYLDAANKIDAAHRKAGPHIRKLLIGQIAMTNLHEIHKKGYMEFELPRSDGGSLTAFRIEHIAPDISIVPASRIGRPVLTKDY